MTEAPYTPETLRRIKQGVSHTALGWSPERLDRVCRQHGIARAQQPFQEHTKREFGALDHDGLGWNIATRQVTYAGAMVEIGGGSIADLFHVLFRILRTGNGTHIDRESLALAAKCSTVRVGSCVFSIRQKLKLIGWDVEAKRQHPDNGYRLVRFEQ